MSLHFAISLYSIYNPIHSHYTLFTLYIHSLYSPPIHSPYTLFTLYRTPYTSLHTNLHPLIPLGYIITSLNLPWLQPISHTPNPPWLQPLTFPLTPLTPQALLFLIDILSHCNTSIHPHTPIHPLTPPYTPNPLTPQEPYFSSLTPCPTATRPSPRMEVEYFATCPA